MPRKPRIHFPGAVYHVLLRGNGGQDIFFDDTDRTRFLFLLQQGVERYGHRIHAYCLMSNHLHLTVQVAEVPLAKSMQNLAFRYTRYMNQRLRRNGHLFQGRYKALLVDQESYLHELVRYIHLNPVRSGMVSDLAAYPWSSHLCYLGRSRTPWLTTDWVLGQLDGKAQHARKQYAIFMQDGLAEGHRREFHCGSFEGRALGDDRFVEDALMRAEESFAKPPTMAAVLDAICREYGADMDSLAGPGRHQPYVEARAAAAWLVRQQGGLRLKDLGAAFGRDLSGLSQAARRIEERAREDETLRDRLERLQGMMPNSVSQA